MKTFIYFCLAVFSVLIFSQCAKDDLPIPKTNIAELEQSFVELDSKSIEISMEMYEQDLIQRTDYDITFQKNNSLSNVEVGSYLVSSIDTPHEDFILRKVLAVDDNGSTVTYTTEPATVVEAYERYYINTDLPSVITVRGDENVTFKPAFEQFSNKMTRLFNSSLSKAGLDTTNFELDIKFLMDGKPCFEAIHPNTAYEIFRAPSDTTSNTTDINPQNGIWDVADNHFGALDQDIEKNGLFTVSISEFGMEEFSINVVHEVGAFNNKKLEGIKKQNVDNVSSAVLNMAKAPVNANNSSEVNMKYIPTGLTVGAFSINAAIGPIIELSGNLSLFASAEMNFSNKVNIKFGHLQWRSSPSFAPSLKITSVTDTNHVVDLSSILDNPLVDIKAGAKGGLEMKFGCAVGIAASTSDANNLGGSIGCAIPVTLNASLNAEGALIASDVLSFETDNISPAGKICLDIGVEASAILFSDINAQSQLVDDLFDYVINFPPSVLSPQYLSFFSWSPDYVQGEGICVGYSACNSIKLNQIVAGVGEADLATMLGFRFDDDNSNTYSLELSYNGGTFQLLGPYNFNEYYKAPLEIPDLVSAGLINNELQVKVIVDDNSCDKTFTPNVTVSSTNCNGVFVDGSNASYGYHPITVTGETVSYFLYEEAIQYQDPNLLPQPEVAMPVIEALDCLNPTGYYIKDESTGNYRVSNADKAYVWISTQPNLHNLLEISINQHSVSPDNKYSFRTLQASESTLAPMLNNF